MHTPRVGNLSLVEFSVLGVDEGVRKVGGIHWDDLGREIGRIVGINGDSVVYTLPMELMGPWVGVVWVV